jgi:hypothetical protein
MRDEHIALVHALRGIAAASVCATHMLSTDLYPAAVLEIAKYGAQGVTASRGPRIIAPDRQAPRICPRMIPLCSRFDSVLFTPKMFRIASYGDYSRSPQRKIYRDLHARTDEVQKWLNRVWKTTNSNH